MDPESPPRKKLKQARLPFQILSPRESESPPSAKKRKLSGGGEDDVILIKPTKISEECKENKEDPHSKIAELQEASDTKEDAECEGVKDEGLPSMDSTSTTDNSLKNQMKLNLSSLFGKVPIAVETDDITNVDSAEEASELESEPTAKRKRSSGSFPTRRRSGKKNTTGSKKNQSVGKKISKKPSTEVNREEKDVEEIHSETTDDDEPSEEDEIDQCSSEEGKKVQQHRKPEKKQEILKKVQLPNEPEANNEGANKNVILSKKTYDMFAKWRKTPSGKPVPDRQPHNIQSPEKAVEVTEETVFSPYGKVQNSGSTSPLEEAPVNADSEVSRTCDGNGPKEEDNDSSSNNVPEDSEATNGSAFEEPEGEKDVSMKEDDPTAAQISECEDSEGSDIVVLSDDTESEAKNSKDCVSQDSPKPLGPLTPKNLDKNTQRRLTPKQLEKQKEAAKKQEEKERQKMEREKEKQRIKNEKEEQKRKEKEEREKKKQAEIEQKNEEKRRKDEQKNEEKRKKDEQKNEEKRKRDEEKRRKDDEKKKMEEEEERKKAKASAMFTSFFVTKAAKVEKEDAPVAKPPVQNFMPFEVKADMRMAPTVRVQLKQSSKKALDELLTLNAEKCRKELYVEILRAGEISPKSSSKTWPLGDMKEDEITVLEQDDGGVFIPQPKKVEKMRVKFLQFHENHRPAYCGTWRKKSSAVTGRKPFGQEKILDYEVDSADEWEEEEPGESLHGSDDEKEQESEDEYELDNSVFVPHGYLSDDEGDADEAAEEVLSPETQKAKLRLLGEQFEAQMKSKTSVLKPIIIVLTAAVQASSLGSARYQKLFERRAVWREDEGPITLSRLTSECENVDSSLALTDNSTIPGSGPGAKKKNITEEAVPALITLIHGNLNKRVFLTNEFSEFLKQYKTQKAETPLPEISEGEKMEVDTPTPSTPDKTNTPSTTSAPREPNPFLDKWPGLPSASRISISNKIKELATWGACPEDGPMLNKMCWYVSEEVRQQYGVSDLTLPNNSWHYTLKPRNVNVPVTTNVADSSSPALITKFTKVMTPDEKKREWESLKSGNAATPSSAKLNSLKKSAGKITAFTCHVKTPNSMTTTPKSEQKEIVKEKSQSIITSCTPSPAQPQAKKRVSLLVSVPRGQQISRPDRPAHCSLLSKFEATATSQPKPNSDSNTKSDAETAIKKDIECVDLD